MLWMMRRQTYRPTVTAEVKPRRQPAYLNRICRRYAGVIRLIIVPNCDFRPDARVLASPNAATKADRSSPYSRAAAMWHQNNQRLPFGESQRHNAGAPKPYRYDSWLRL